MLSDERWQRLIDGLRAGDSRTEYEFWENYGPALQCLAEQYLSPKLQARIGSDDIVLSACRTFLRRMRLGEFHLDDSRALWRILTVITVRKVREQARYHRCRKRSVAQEISQSPCGGDGVVLIDPYEDPAEAVALVDQMEQLLALLDEEERTIVLQKLQDLTNDEVAERLQLSERTVRRKLKCIRARLASVMQAG
jgi:RNA polymerase sigma factor (sigma-70 family)